VPGAEKLLKLTLDIGSEQRTVSPDQIRVRSGTTERTPDRDGRQSRAAANEIRPVGSMVLAAVVAIRVNCSSCHRIPARSRHAGQVIYLAYGIEHPRGLIQRLELTLLQSDLTAHPD